MSTGVGDLPASADTDPTADAREGLTVVVPADPPPINPAVARVLLRILLAAARGHGLRPPGTTQSPPTQKE
jgi:hypothetical protein